MINRLLPFIITTSIVLFIIWVFTGVLPPDVVDLISDKLGISSKQLGVLLLWITLFIFSIQIVKWVLSQTLLTLITFILFGIIFISLLAAFPPPGFTTSQLADIPPSMIDQNKYMERVEPCVRGIYEFPIGCKLGPLDVQEGTTNVK